MDDDPCSVGSYEVFDVSLTQPNSVLYMARDHRTNLPVFLKQFRRDDPISACALQQELATLTDTFHPLLCSLYEVVEHDRFVYLALECPSEGTLRDFVRKAGAVPENQARLILVQLLAVFEYLHYDRHLIVRNLTSLNVSFDSNKNVRVGGFIASGQGESEFRTCARCDLESYYTAPELIMEQPVTTAVDIWSLGVVFFELVTGRLPFETGHHCRLHQKILRTDPVFPSTVSPLLCDLLSRMLTKDPMQRITLENIKEHPWVITEGGVPLFLDLNGIEALRTGTDPSAGVVDHAIVNTVSALGIDVVDLPRQLLAGAQSDATAAYLQLLRAQITESLVEVVPGLLQRQTASRRSVRRVDFPSRRSLPQIEPTKILICRKARSLASFEAMPRPDVQPPQAARPADMLPDCCIPFPPYSSAAAY
jgi:serine/threonine protein kinase